MSVVGKGGKSGSGLTGKYFGIFRTSWTWLTKYQFWKHASNDVFIEMHIKWSYLSELIIQTNKQTNQVSFSDTTTFFSPSCQASLVITLVKLKTVISTDYWTPWQSLQSNSFLENIFFIWLPEKFSSFSISFSGPFYFVLPLPATRTEFSPGLPFYLHTYPFRGSQALSSLALCLCFTNRYIFSSP